MTTPAIPSPISRFRWRYWLLWIGGSILALLAIGAGSVYFLLHGSLAQLDGTITLPDFQATVTVERDALGIPTIRGENRLDVARATGFIHAQERFFQMDVLRRAAAGELAELFGISALWVDRKHRVHRFRHRAQQAFAAAIPQDQQIMTAYTAGVNAGLAALSVRPFEYLLLQTDPKPWRPEDTLLTVYTMYLDLNHNQWVRESVRGLLHQRLPPELAAFLDPAGTEWDAPLLGDAFTAPPLPNPDIFDLRRPAISDAIPTNFNARESLAENFAFYPLDSDPEEAVSGSNNWAIAGRLTTHGGALLANDMHLKLRVPNIWYRTTFIYPDDQSRERRITGVTLPGAPAIVVGSNGHLAWGFTNSEGDWADLVILEAGEDDEHYQTPDGSRRFIHVQETLNIRNAPAETLEVLETIWGPVIDHDDQGRQRVLRWVAHDTQAANLRLMDLEQADTLDAAMAAAHMTGSPAQNILFATADGQIAWTISGRIPRRFGHSGHVPTSWADGQHGWDGWLASKEYPRIVNPPSGRLWTANARTVDGAWLNVLGDGGYSLGARAQQIRDALSDEQGHFTEADFLALQLDNRALFLQRWRELLLEILTPEVLQHHPERAQVQQLVTDWSGRAALDSVGYRLVRSFRLRVRDRAFAPLVVACVQADPSFDYTRIRQYEGALWQLISRKPPHLLDPRYADWSALLLDAVDEVLAQMNGQDQPLVESTWGDYNQVHIQHPFSRVMPWLSGWLDMPARSLPGDIYMPRIQTRHSGSSERMAVAPGREADGILHMPSGQSGHPLSPYYRAGFDAWATGQPLPFLPGAVQHQLVLMPEVH